MAIEKEIKISVDTKGATSNLKSFNSELENTENVSQNTNDGLSKMSSSALESVKNFKFMGVSINSVSKALKLFKITLISTGIGAIVVAVGALAAAFLSTQSGVDKLNSVLTPLKEVLETVWGITQKLGEGLFQMISGDITGGFDKMASSVENLGSQMKEAYDRGLELHELQIRIRNNQIEEITAVTKLNIQRAKALQIAEDTTKSDKERQDAYKEAIASENSIAMIRKSILLDRIRELELSQEANDTSSDEFKELVQLRADADNAEFDRLTRVTALTKRLNTIKVEGVKEETEAQKERKKVLGINTEMSNPDEALLFDKLVSDKKILLDRNTQDAIARYREEIRQEDANRTIETEEMVKDAKMQIANQTLFLLSEIAGKGSAVGKALAVGQATLSGIEGVQNAFTTASKSPITTVFPAYPYVQAGLAGAFSALQIKKILSTDAMGKGGAGGSGGSVPTPSAPSFNLVQGTGANQITEGLQNQSQPIEAYVVSSNVTTSQELDRKIINGASLG